LLDAAGRIRGMLSVHYSQPRTAMGCDIASFQTLAARVPALIYAKS
jgi:hypothetical protein